MAKEESLFGAREVTDSFRNFFLAQSNIVNSILKESKLDERSSQIRVVLGSACQTACAIARLSEIPDLFSAECVMLARAFLEKVINFCYLLTCDQAEFNRFFKHTIQKSHRKLDKKISLDGHTLSVKFKGADSLCPSSVLQEAVREFTSNSGKEIKYWTKASLTDRISIICKNSKLHPAMFLFHTLTIYEDASEALHGTLYGCSFHTGAYDPTVDKKDKNDVKRNIQKNISLLLFQLGIAFDQAVLLLSEKNNLAAQLQASNANVDSARGLMNKILK